jgi:hypothetical protein
MSNKIRYEYEVVVGDNGLSFIRGNREQARQEMGKWKASGFDAKIVQRKFKLETEQVVR